MSSFYPRNQLLYYLSCTQNFKIRITNWTIFNLGWHHCGRKLVRQIRRPLSQRTHKPSYARHDKWGNHRRRTSSKGPCQVHAGLYTIRKFFEVQQCFSSPQQFDQYWPASFWWTTNHLPSSTKQHTRYKALSTRDGMLVLLKSILNLFFFFE